MSLQFEKLAPQVTQMGIELASRSITVAEQTELAGQFLMGLNDLDAIWQQIMVAREKDAGFRGAGPLDESINQPIPLFNCPTQATILASDGSQIYPDPHGAALYWLTNIGVFVYYHGEDTLPEVITEPQLYFRDEDVRGPDDQMIANAAINARRAVYEMQQLARETLKRRNLAKPLLTIYDGPLLNFPMGKEVANAPQLSADYHESMSILQNIGAALTGYVDRPSSRFLIYTLYLMSLHPDEIRRGVLQNVGALERLTDADLYKLILGAGERSGMMVQQSPQNKEYREAFGVDQEIVFFYLNVSATHQEPYLARVEVPMWVARDKAMVAVVQALIYAQCQITDRYPYALTRADEIAVVHPVEKRAVDDMITVELLRNRQPVENSQKLSSKGLARFGRQQHQGV